MKDEETLRLGDGESPYFRQFVADVEASGGIVFDTSDFKLEAEPEVPEVPACVAVAKLPKTRQVVRRPMTEEEAVLVQAIRCCVRFSPGHWDKRFMRELPEEITDRQAVQVWRIFKTYRRQIEPARCGITPETKEALLRKAAVVEAFQAKGEG